MHIRDRGMSGLRKGLLIAAVAAAVISLVVRFTGLNLNIFSSNYDDEAISEDICRSIMEKTIPALDVSTGVDTIPAPEDAMFSFIKYIGSVDVGNPRSYLMSQIPLLSFYNINTFSVTAGGISGKSTSTDANTGANTNPVQTTPASYNVDQSKPAVIMYHTHTRESFTPTALYSYNMGKEDHRTSNMNLNVCRVGEEIKNYLEKNYGIAAVNDTTVHDFPYYSGSYKRSRPTAQNLIKKYPNASIILDVHRDAGVTYKNMVMNVDGKTAAKVMFVIGKGNPHWQENLALAQKLSAEMEKLYPGFVKKTTYASNITYNQDLSNRSMIIEIGASCNTLEEVLVSADMVARSIGEYLKGN